MVHLSPGLSDYGINLCWLGGKGAFDACLGGCGSCEGLEWWGALLLEEVINRWDGLGLG